jgi:hypothetical protein
MDEDGTPDRPSVRASDAEREAAVVRLQVAVGEGRIDLDEFGRRADAAYAAVMTAELEALLADLPTAATGREIVGTRTPEDLRSIFGDIRVAGGSTAPRRAGTVFGDVRIDLRGLRTDADRLELHLTTVFGEVDVVVSEGVEAELHGWTLFGDRRTELTPVPRLAGTPVIVVHARSVFGDLTVRSLAPGESPSRWRAVLERLAQRRMPPPPLPGAPPPFPPPPF